MQSSVWGPKLWNSMFYIAAGYDLNETPKHIKDPQYANFFKSFGDTLPCRFCRESYVKFYDALDIRRYMNMPSCGLIRFVYDLKEQVNHKLKSQEEKALYEEFQKLTNIVSLDDPRFWKMFREKAQKICYTKPTPPFEEIVQEIMKHRASCSAKMKTCRDPMPPKFPAAPTQQIQDPNDSGILDRDMYSGGGKRRVTRSVTRKSATSSFKNRKSRKRTVSRKRNVVSRKKR